MIKGSDRGLRSIKQVRIYREKSKRLHNSGRQRIRSEEGSVKLVRLLRQ